MNTFVILLRGINVGGHRKIKMADLKQLLRDNAFEHIETYIQSGNIICQSPQKKTSAVKQQIETLIAESYGFQVSAFVMHATEFKQLFDNNPFVNKQHPIEKLYCTILEHQPKLEDADELLQLSNKQEAFNLRGNVIYLCYQLGYGKATITNPFVEKKLKMKASTRNWKTITKLLDMLSRYLNL